MRVLKVGSGFLLTAAGLVMLVTPGPGVVAIALGLALLGSEYEWARHWRERLRDKGTKLADRLHRG